MGTMRNIFAALAVGVEISMSALPVRAAGSDPCSGLTTYFEGQSSDFSLNIGDTETFCFDVTSAPGYLYLIETDPSSSGVLISVKDLAEGTISDFGSSGNPIPTPIGIHFPTVGSYETSLYLYSDPPLGWKDILQPGFELSWKDTLNPAGIPLLDAPAGVPGPIAGAGLPGLVFGFGALFTWLRTRKGRANVFRVAKRDLIGSPSLSPSSGAYSP
jgi:hypothetical protein